MPLVGTVVENSWTDPKAALSQARALLDGVARRGLRDLDDETVLQVTTLTEEVGRKVDAIRVDAAAEVAERSRYELGADGLGSRYGYAKAVHFLEHLTRVSGSEAARRVKLGTSLRTGTSFTGAPLPAPHPHVAEAMRAGKIGVDAASTITRTLDTVLRDRTVVASADHGGVGPTAEDLEAIDEAEALLTDAAASVPADLVQVQAGAWREALDPDGSEPRDALIHVRRGLHIGREREGIVRLVWDVEPVVAARLAAVLWENDHAATPRFLPTEDHGSGSTPGTDPGTELTDVVDTRTIAQRHSDILAGLLLVGMQASANETGLTRSTATVLVQVSAADLEAGTGVGWVDGITAPISMSRVEALACAHGTQKVLLGNSGEILYLGPAPRLFSQAQRRALAVRDGGCISPNCTATSRECDAHHVIPYSEGGPTDIDNAVLLCERHHTDLHRSHHKVQIINGVPHILAPPWIDHTQTWRPAGHNRVAYAAQLSRRRTANRL